jgi:hypothetical protein
VRSVSWSGAELTGRRPLQTAAQEACEVIKAFSDPSTEDKYLKLRFVPDGLALKLTVGEVSVYAVEHPWKGAALTLESITPRTATQYEVACPTKCSREQIAGLIYVNIAKNFRGSAEAFKAHFQRLGVPLFQ